MKQDYLQSSDTFTRIFYPTSKGNALLNPSPPIPLVINGKGGTARGNGYRERGMLIGDVILRAPQGRVHYLFNVTLPADDPRNTRGAPPDFAPILLDPEIDLIVSDGRFPKCGIFGATNDVEKPFVFHELKGPHNLRVTSAASEGALFALPLGGSSYECTPSGLEKLRDFALEHGQRWHEHVSGKLSCQWTNGYMCLVTGCDKTRFWASAFYQNVDGESDFSSDLDMSMSPTSPGVFLRNSDYSGPAGTHQMGSTDCEDTAVERHCLAFRAFHISLQPALFLALRSIQGMDYKPLNPFFFLPSSIRPPVKSFEEVWSPFDPLLKINQLLHKSTPRVVTAVVHDNDLVAILDPKDNRLPSIRELKQRITRNSFIAVTADSKAYLIKRSEYDRGLIGRCFGALRVPLAALGFMSFAAVKV
ncbi:hypothetical protein BDZ89DRAFT_1162200 [Hymenopellis radicata]|nr:hypothetical protein BDZ89DRAFT_1162200 [Hymenopellis radicata]